MEIRYEESFEKDLLKIVDNKIKKKIIQVIANTKQANKPQDIANLKKLENYKTYYRIRIGNYRIGIEIIKDKLIFTRILPRKDIYKFFP
ncbi:MAG: type II toxin-antitoxin system RelE family toxin [Ignavibacteriaceae bacterium]